jgi:hypothetical protein
MAACEWDEHRELNEVHLSAPQRLLKNNSAEAGITKFLASAD